MNWSSLPVLGLLAACAAHPARPAASPVVLLLPPIAAPAPPELRPKRAATGETDLFSETEAARGRAARLVLTRTSDPAVNDQISAMLSALQGAVDRVRAAEHGQRQPAVSTARRLLRELIDYLVAHGG